MTPRHRMSLLSRPRWVPPVVIVAALGIVAGVGWIISDLTTRPDGSDATTNTSLPKDAVPIPNAAGGIETADGSTLLVKSETCRDLQSMTAADGCVEVGNRGAVTVSDLGGRWGVDVYSFSTSAMSPLATRQLTGDFDLVDGAGDVETLRILESSDWPLVIIEHSVTPFLEQSRSRLQIVSFGDDFARVEADIESARWQPFYRAASLLMFAESYQANDDVCCPTSLVLYNLIPSVPRWYMTTETLDASMVEEMSRRSREFETRYFLDNLVPVATTTTTLPVTTTSQVPDVAGDIWCNGSWITIVGSHTAASVDQARQAFPGAQVGRTTDMCPSLAPYFTVGPSTGEPIYVIYFGPVWSRLDAQQVCRDMGFISMSDCYVAPLTLNTSDRNVRFGPYG